MMHADGVAVDLDRDRIHSPHDKPAACATAVLRAVPMITT
jgi:hypothetical protein